MEFLQQIKHFIDPNTLISFGYWVLAFIVFAESGLFFGFFLPGDSLLMVAGIAAAAGTFKIGPLVLILFISAFLGDQVGYWSGSRFGRAIFKENSRFFNMKYVLESEKFFAKHGPKAIILARFVPVIRTFTPILAGVGKMHYKTFVLYNLIGAFLWGVGVTYVGYLMGSKIPNIEKYVHYIIFGVIALSIIPAYHHWHTARKGKK